MRELSFVKKVKFNIVGSVTKRALVIGDADNDLRNELVCANLQGDLAIFKEINREKFAYANDLGMITACAIGNVIDLHKNFVIAINMEGWLFIFDATNVKGCTRNDDGCIVQSIDHKIAKEGIADDDKSIDKSPKKLAVFYEQRMPANCKEILLADLDGDGQNELIIGLTDRVLRTYKWVNIGIGKGKFVGLYKWEFAAQRGSLASNPSRQKDCMDIIVAQPGGTYARLECFDKKPLFTPGSSNDGGSSDSDGLDKRFFSTSTEQTEQTSKSSSHDSPNAEQGDDVKTEYINKLTPEYHQLALTQMRNHHISTEVLGGIKDGRGSDAYTSLVIATLDGTLMLVNKDEILWSLQVDHQLFALAVIEERKQNDIKTSLPQSESTCTIVAESDNYSDLNRSIHTAEKSPTKDSTTEDRSAMFQYFVVCAWNGKTYIVDEERNYLRFKFDEAVSAFAAGNYYFGGQHHSALVYATFNNEIVLYYDVVSEEIRPKYLLDEIMNNPSYDNLHSKLTNILDRLDAAELDARSSSDQDKSQKLYDLVQELLYNVTDEDLID